MGSEELLPHGPTAPPVYPRIPSNDQTLYAQQQSEYRMKKIDEIKKYLETEIILREKLYKKYRRIINSFVGINATCSTGSFGVAVVAFALPVSSVVALPIAGALAGVTIVGAIFKERLEIKAKKHDEIKILAKSKLNSIADKVSYCLKDGRIDEREFSGIMAELDKYDQMKNEIRHKAFKKFESFEIRDQIKKEVQDQVRGKLKTVLNP